MLIESKNINHMKQFYDIAYLLMNQNNKKWFTIF